MTDYDVYSIKRPAHFKENSEKSTIKVTLKNEITKKKIMETIKKNIHNKEKITTPFIYQEYLHLMWIRALQIEIGIYLENSKNYGNRGSNIYGGKLEKC